MATQAGFTGGPGPGGFGGTLWDQIAANQQAQSQPQASTQTQSTQPTPTQAPAQQTQDSGFGAQPVIHPGQQLPGSGAGDAPLQAPQPLADTGTRQSFLSPNLTAPSYNAAAVAGNAGTAMGQLAGQSANMVPQANSFMSGLFSNNLNPMEQSFMGASLGNSLVGMQQGMNRQEAQFEGTPFHSALPQAQGAVMEQMFRDMFQQGSQMGLQREGLATQVANSPFNNAMTGYAGASQQAQVGPQMAQGMFNMANAHYNSPQSLPLALWSGVPISAPTVLASQGGKSA